MIKLKTFGSFTVGNDLTSVQEGAWRSKKLEKLFVYLAINRNRGVCIEDISKAIWQVEEETDNPVGALKNLAYRLRKALRDASFDEECIVSVRGGLYKWNDDVEVSIDVEEFDRYINEAEFAFSRSKETAIESYEKAIALYNGDFLSRLTDTHWFMTLNAFYHSRYVNTVKALAELYIDTGCYEKLEQLCTKAVVYERSDEQIYSYLILARMRTKKVQMAFDTYETAKAIMDNDLGVRKTVMLNKVYEELLSVTKGVSSYNIDEVKDDISEESMNGVFMCGYPVFKEIYHLEVRKSARSTVPESLVLVTVVPMYSSQPDKNHSHMKDSMLILERALRKCLRVGDVAAKYSDSQYIVLLSKCSCDTASDVMKRIIDRFNHTCDTNSNMTIQFDIEPVSCYSSFVTDKKWRKYMVKKVIRFIVLIIGLSLVAYSGYHLFKIYSDYNTSDKTYEKLQDEYAVDDSKKNDDSSEAQLPWYDDIDIDFAGLRSENPDVVGWIYFENEDISYPVMYSGDNSYYLRKTFKREHATAGSIFLEGSNKTDFSDCHTIIYGHNMKNLSMFGKLKYYNRDENYYDSHQYFQILVDGKKYRYQIFSYETVSDDSDEYTVGFEPDETFGKFVQRMAASSMKDTGIVPTKDDKVVTLSTCSTSGETYRFVVHGVRVDEH